MRHLKDEEIFEYRTAITGGIKRALQTAHIKKCDHCRSRLEAEEKLAAAFSRRLSANLDKFAPSNMMDAKVRHAIDEIAPKMPSPFVWLLRKSLTTGLVIALVASVYSLFFYAPLFGSAKETPAQAFVSSMMTPVISKAKSIIPQSIYSKSQDIDKYIFLNIWCSTYNICEADRLRLIQLEGHNYSDVFIASFIGQVYEKPVDKVLPMLEKGMTPGQIFSELEIPFTSQISSVGQASTLIDMTKTQIDTNKTVVLPIKKENGKIFSPIPLDDQSQKKILNQPDGVYDATIARDGKLEETKAVPSGYGFHKGTITNVDYDKEVLSVQTDNGTITVKIASDTTINRYGQSILSNQLGVGQQTQINATKVDGLFVASLIDVADPDVTVNVNGEIVAYENKSLAVRGFGAELLITPTTQINGTIEKRSQAKIVAIGNDTKGYRVKSISVTKPPVNTNPTKEKLETVEGIVVAIDTDESGRKFMLLSDGMMIGYSTNQKFTKIQGEPLAIGMKISSLGLMQGTHNQEARAIIVTDTDAAEGFEMAGELEDYKCLNNCSWVDTKGVSQIMLRGLGAQFVIYPKTVNHLKVNLTKKGQTVILEGRIIEGVRLVDRLEVVEPQNQFIHKGEIVSIENGLVKLDNQTQIRLRSFTRNASQVAVGKTASITCYKSDKGLVALEVKIDEGKDTVSTGWSKIASFNGTILTLEDGTKLAINDATEIVTGYLMEKGDKSSLIPGLKVSCTYIKGETNVAVKIMVFEGQ
jgi:hypothetical protein